jgi:NadR type nicotinamide-nucleotide adenylyltransferase
MEEQDNIKRIAIIGPESTGKSRLTQELANWFETEWVREYARSYLDQLTRNYHQPDLLEIAKGQMKWEDNYVKKANRYLFCDTNLIVIKIWSDDKFGSTDPRILHELSSRKYVYHLLTNTETPWAADLQREDPDRRNELFESYESFLLQNNLPYTIVTGLGNSRLKCAVEALKEI